MKTKKKMGRPTEIKGKLVSVFLGEAEIKLLAGIGNRSLYIRELIQRDNRK